LAEYSIKDFLAGIDPVVEKIKSDYSVNIKGPWGTATWGDHGELTNLFYVKYKVR
jgi:hypothetical protein